MLTAESSNGYEKCFLEYSIKPKLKIKGTSNFQTIFYKFTVNYLTKKCVTNIVTTTGVKHYLLGVCYKTEEKDERKTYSRPLTDDDYEL